VSLRRVRLDIIEPFHRTMLDDHLRAEGRKTWLETSDEMQKALDPWLPRSRCEAAHEHRAMSRRTLLKALTTAHPAGRCNYRRNRQENRRQRTRVAWSRLKTRYCQGNTDSLRLPTPLRFIKPHFSFAVIARLQKICSNSANSRGEEQTVKFPTKHQMAYLFGGPP